MESMERPVPDGIESSLTAHRDPRSVAGLSILCPLAKRRRRASHSSPKKPSGERIDLTLCPRKTPDIGRVGPARR